MLTAEIAYELSAKRKVPALLWIMTSEVETLIFSLVRSSFKKVCRSRRAHY